MTRTLRHSSVVIVLSFRSLFTRKATRKAASLIMSAPVVFYGYNMQSSNPSHKAAPRLTAKLEDPDLKPREFARGLGLFDSIMVVVGAMIGSGIFIVPAEMARHIGSAGWLLVAWGVAGMLTIAGALCYGELSAMMPQAGGMYVYLREAYSPLWGFLYGWTLFSVIETGTIAAVAVAFARFSGVLWPLISEDKYLIAPIRLSSHYALSLSTAQLLAIASSHS